MPNSIRENNNDVRAFVATHPEIESALDVGAGEGTYHALLHDLIPEIDAVEIHAPNIEDYSLKARYREVFLADIRDFAATDQFNSGYDLIIFGDVLEHMDVEDAVMVFNAALMASKWVLVSVPMQHFEQGAIDGNEHEVHHIEDPQDELIPELPQFRYGWRYQITGTFIWEGDLLHKPKYVVTPDGMEDGLEG